MRKLFLNLIFISHFQIDAIFCFAEILIISKQAPDLYCIALQNPSGNDSQNATKIVGPVKLSQIVLTELNEMSLLGDVRLDFAIEFMTFALHGFYLGPLAAKLAFSVMGVGIGVLSYRRKLEKQKTKWRLKLEEPSLGLIAKEERFEILSLVSPLSEASDRECSRIRELLPAY